jgi:16S rRNA C1402 (ribose-2'-O) methylase RsmI
LCRELTKLHEEFDRGTLAECLARLETTGAGYSQDASAARSDDSGSTTGTSRVGSVTSGGRIRGEFTVVLGPLPPSAAGDEGTVDERIRSRLCQLRDDGMRRSEAVKTVVEILKIPKTRVYKIALDVDFKKPA